MKKYNFEQYLTSTDELIRELAKWGMITKTEHEQNILQRTIKYLLWSFELTDVREMEMHLE